MLTASNDMAAMVASGFLRIAASLTINLPAGDYSDFTLSIVSITWDTTNTTDLPNGVAVEEGYATTSGTVVLKGALDKRDSTKTPVWLLNPDDPSSPLYRLHNKVKRSPFLFKWGVRVDGNAPELLTAITGQLTDWDVDTITGIITARFADVSVGWGKLPALSAVITDTPWNAGCTNEYVIDRIARNLPTPRLTWPAQRSQCVLAVGMRTAIWPEVGTIDTSKPAGVPTFTSGVFGSALTYSTSRSFANYVTASPMTGDDVFTEFWTKNLTSGQLSCDIGSDASNNGGIQIIVDPTQWVRIVVADDSGNYSDIWDADLTLDGSAHYIGVHVHWPNDGSHTWSADVHVDNIVYSSGTRTLAGLGRPASFSKVGYATSGGPATIEAVQVTTESAPLSNAGFTPTAFLDVSLNPLQAVPAIPAGTAAMDEFQTITGSEGGYLFADNLGNLRFLNRKTILSQSPVRYLKQGEAIISIGSTIGATVQYDDVAIDYTEWAFGDKALLFSPKVKWRVEGDSTQEWIRDLPNGGTAALVDGTIGLLADGHDPTDGNSWFLASFDRYGNGTPVKGTVTAAVQMLTPSRVKITVTNSNHRDVWLVAPSSQVTQPVGTVALWIGGVPVSADQPTTVHINYTSTPHETFDAPTNDYRQDRDATLTFGRDLYGWLHVARPDYGNSSIRPDPRLQVGDLVTADLPIARGKSVPAKAVIWGQTITLDFSSKSATHQVSMRRLAPPGAWELGKSTLGQDNYLYGEAAA